MAIDAFDGRGVARLAVKLAVAVHVGEKMAIAALHSVRKVDVLQVNGLGEFLGIVIRDRAIAEVEQVAFAILFENGAKDPAVTVIIGKLGVLELRIQLGDIFEEIGVAPKPARRGGFRINGCRPNEFVIGRVVLDLGIHEFAIGFLVPPGVTEIRIHEQIALMHVAVHALAGRNRARELVHDRMPALVFRDRWVGAEAEPLMAVLAPPTGIGRRAIVGVDDVTGGAAAGAVIARMIVRPEKAEERIVQPRLLNAEQDRIGPVQSAETALGETTQRTAGRFVDRRDAELELLFTALFEDAQDVSGVAEVETRDRLEIGQDAVNLGVVRRDWRVVDEAQGNAVRAVSLTVTIVFVGDGAVVVHARRPRAWRRDSSCCGRPCARSRRGRARRLHPPRAGRRVDKADELRRLVIEPDIGAGWVGRSAPELRITRQDMRFFFC